MGDIRKGDVMNKVKEKEGLKDSKSNSSKGDVLLLVEGKHCDPGEAA